MIEVTSPTGRNVISLEVPGIIECMDVVLRIVSSACKLIMPGSQFTDHVVSAVGEAYSNIVLHGYAGREPGSIEMQIENSSEGMRVMMRDTGTSFDPSQTPVPDLDALPESGLGIFIMRSFVDEVTYVPGSPNTLTLVKRLPEAA
jgi:serine/threonine-protein kinase RsbW